MKKVDEKMTQESTTDGETNEETIWANCLYVGTRVYHITQTQSLFLYHQLPNEKASKFRVFADRETKIKDFTNAAMP